jgi:hypothetical protein
MEVATPPRTFTPIHSKTAKEEAEIRRIACIETMPGGTLLTFVITAGLWPGDILWTLGIIIFSFYVVEQLPSRPMKFRVISVVFN